MIESVLFVDADINISAVLVSRKIPDDDKLFYMSLIGNLAPSRLLKNVPFTLRQAQGERNGH